MIDETTLAEMIAEASEQVDSHLNGATQEGVFIPRLDKWEEVKLVARELLKGRRGQKQMVKKYKKADWVLM